MRIETIDGQFKHMDLQATELLKAKLLSLAKVEDMLNSMPDLPFWDKHMIADVFDNYRKLIINDINEGKYDKLRKEPLPLHKVKPISVTIGGTTPLPK